MTREDFIQMLNKGKYTYEVVGDKIVVLNNCDNVDLSALTTLPPGVQFNNSGGVYLNSLTTLPSGVRFNNGGDIVLDRLEFLHPHTIFNNRGDVYLNGINIPREIQFNNVNNGGALRIASGFINDDYLIDGIDSTRLLNIMIKRGVFE
jgi:hypothetical protein